jgi:phage FluMu protein Com
MQTALFLSWAFCPKCNDWLVHKKFTKQASLTCPQCRQVNRCSVWHQMPQDIDALNLHLVNARAITLLRGALPAAEITTIEK